MGDYLAAEEQWEGEKASRDISWTNTSLWAQAIALKIAVKKFDEGNVVALRL